MANEFTHSFFKKQVNLTFKEEIIFKEQCLSFITRKIVEDVLLEKHTSYTIVLPAPESTVGVYSSKFLRYIDLTFTPKPEDDQHITDLKSLVNVSYIKASWKLNIKTLMNMLDDNSKFYCDKRNKDEIGAILEDNFVSRINFF